MVKVKNDEGKKIYSKYDLESAKKAIANGAIIPLKYDDCFKSVIINNRKHLVWYLSKLLNKSEEEIDNKLIYKNIELKNKRAYEKRKRVDGIFELELENINIEINLDYNSVIDRNLVYICKIFSEDSEIGDNYINVKSALQININFEKNHNKHIIEKYYLMTEENKKLTEKLQIWNINMDRLVKKWYSKDIKEEEYKHLLLLCCNTRSELENLVKGDIKMKNIADSQKEYSTAEKFVIYRHENDTELKYNTGMKYYLNKGKEEGILQGTEYTKKVIVENMLRNGLKKELISKIADISITKINKIENNIKQI